MIELTEEQKKNLKIFLGRVQLSGVEVAAFNELVAVLFAAPRGNCQFSNLGYNEDLYRNRPVMIWGIVVF